MRLPPERIATERLVLRKPRPDDLADVFAYASDPQNVLYVAFPCHRTEQDTLDFFEIAARGWESGVDFPMLIELSAGGAGRGPVIGSTGFRVIDGAADIGYIVRRQYWNRGYASEAAAGLVAWLRAESAFTKLRSYVHQANPVSMHVLEKLGLRRVGAGTAAFPNLTPPEQATFEYEMDLK